MATRPSKTSTFLAMARLLSMQSTCARRNVGVIMTDVNHRIVASGYNGNGKGLPHCIDSPCLGANCLPGQGLELCVAIHAEQNALMQCSDVMSIHSVYCTTAPCVHCTKMLLNTGAKNIYFVDNYPHADQSRSIWTGHWEQVKL